MKRLYIFSLLLFAGTLLANAVNARLDSMLIYSTNGETFTQTGSFKFYYNVQNQIIKEVLSGLDDIDIPDGGFEADMSKSQTLAMADTTFEIAYTYNSNGQIGAQYTLLNNGGNRDTILKEELAYAENGKLTGKAQYIYDEDMGQWMMFTTVEYAYENDLLLTESTFVSIFPLPPMLFEKTEYTYNIAGKLTSKVTFDVAPIMGTLSNSEKTEYEYTDGKLTAETYYTTTIEGAWLPETRDEYAYDGSGNINLVRGKEWDISTNGWIQYDKSVLTIDYSISNPTLILPRFFTDEAGLDDIFTAVVTLVETFVEADLALTKSALVDVRTEYTELYWTIDGQTQVEIVESSAAKLYPNPNQGNFVVSTDNNVRATIINLSGQVVYQQNLPAGTHSISLQNPEKGMYILQLKDGKNAVNQKFAVE